MSTRCVLTLPLKTEIWQEDIINKRLEIGRRIYNNMLAYELKKYRELQESEEYKSVTETLFELAKNENKGCPEYKTAGKKRNELLREHGFSEFGFIADVAMFSSKYSEHIGATAASISIAKPMWTAFETMLYSKGDMVHFKKKGSMNSIATDGKSFLRLTDARGKTLVQRTEEKELFVTYGNVRGKNNAIHLPVCYDIKNNYEMEMLSMKIKQIRIVRKKEKGVYKYYVQFCVEGKPAVKYTVSGEEKHPIGTGRIGLFVTTSNVTVASEKGIRKYSLSDGVADHSERIDELLRYMENSRRAMNSDNYNEDGTIKKGIMVEGERRPLKWKYSKGYYKAKDELSELYRLEKIHRELHHHKLANDILSLGNDIRTNDYSFAYAARRSEKDEMKKDGTPASKKRGGKNINKNAPAFLIEIIAKKLKYMDKEIVKIRLNDIPEFKDAVRSPEYWAEYLFNL